MRVKIFTVLLPCTDPSSFSPCYFWISLCSLVLMLPWCCHIYQNCSLSTTIMCGWLASPGASHQDLGSSDTIPAACSCLSVFTAPPTMCLTVTGSSLLMFFRTCYCAAGPYQSLLSADDTFQWRGLVFHAIMSSSSLLSVLCSFSSSFQEAVFVIYSWMLLVSSWIVTPSPSIFCIEMIFFGGGCLCRIAAGTAYDALDGLGADFHIFVMKISSE